MIKLQSDGQILTPFFKFYVQTENVEFGYLVDEFYFTDSDVVYPMHGFIKNGDFEFVEFEESQAAWNYQGNVEYVVDVRVRNVFYYILRSISWDP